MCKLLAVLDIEDEDLALSFTELAVKPMTENDKDGLGTIKVGPDGVGVARWRYPKDFPHTKTPGPFLEKYKDLIEPVYNTEGPTSQTGLWALGVHSRMATCGKTLQNTHPFVKEDLALIHNGVITNHAGIKKTLSSCDSEALLTKYLEHDVKNNFENLQLVCDDVTGWYAFMVFSKDGYVDIVRDDRTSLYFAHVEDIGTVFATTEGIIKSAAGRMKREISDIYEMPPLTAIRWRKDAPLETLPLFKTEIVKQGTTVVDISKEVLLSEHTDLDRCDHGVLVGSWCLPCYERDASDDAGALPYSHRVGGYH